MFTYCVILYNFVFFSPFRTCWNRSKQDFHYPSFTLTDYHLLWTPLWINLRHSLCILSLPTYVEMGTYTRKRERVGLLIRNLSCFLGDSKNGKISLVATEWISTNHYLIVLALLPINWAHEAQQILEQGLSSPDLDVTAAACLCLPLSLWPCPGLFLAIWFLPLTTPPPLKKLPRIILDVSVCLSVCLLSFSFCLS